MVSGRLNPRSHFPHLRAPRPPQKAARLGPSSLKPAGQGCHPEACLLLQPHTDGHVGQPCRGETGRSSMPLRSQDSASGEKEEMKLFL